ncbi:MAG: tetratricopeptide repeat protein [Spirochaetales bacterium]|nr:tetratricopeptide repeat protein [Spirochaetales bacterium]
MRLIIVSIIGILILTASGCMTKIDPYQEDISRVELLQKAYEATDARNHSLALSYYQAFLQRFPDDEKGCLWAQYEIAFLYHKIGNNKKSLQLFDELLQKYEKDENGLLPQAPKVLAEKVIKNISKAEPKTE